MPFMRILYWQQLEYLENICEFIVKIGEILTKNLTLLLQFRKCGDIIIEMQRAYAINMRLQKDKEETNYA